MDPFNAELRQELLDRMARDQAMRQAIAERYKPGVSLAPAELAELEEARQVDRANTARLREIVAQYGWPGRTLVGDDGANAAWLLVQHADQDVDFQRQSLALLEAAVAAGEASVTNLAYLVDRVRVHEGRLQLYGTQLRTVNGELTAGEIEDEAQVDERRARVGLGPLSEYVGMVKRLHEKE